LLGDCVEYVIAVVDYGKKHVLYGLQRKDYYLCWQSKFFTHKGVNFICNVQNNKYFFY